MWYECILILDRNVCDEVSILKVNELVLMDQNGIAQMIVKKCMMWQIFGLYTIFITRQNVGVNRGKLIMIV